MSGRQLPTLGLRVGTPLLLVLSLTARVVADSPATARGAQDPDHRRRVGAWVIAGASGLATYALTRKTLEHWEQSRILAARSQDLSRPYRERLSLHEQAQLEWETGNRDRNIAAATTVATVTAAILLFRLYDGEVPAPEAGAFEQAESTRFDWHVAGAGDGGVRLEWKLHF